VVGWIGWLKATFLRSLLVALRVTNAGVGSYAMSIEAKKQLQYSHR
jgi:hypothetical protein